MGESFDSENTSEHIGGKLQQLDAARLKWILKK